MSKADVDKYFQKHPCEECGQWAKRVPSAANPVFKGNGKPGQSGFHDVDYPILDKAVGRSAAKKWGVYDKRKQARDKIRQSAGTPSLTISGDKVAPTSPEKLVLRERAINTFNKARDKSR